MNAETEKELRGQIAALQQAYVAFAGQVRTAGLKIAGHAGAGQCEQAGIAALELVTLATAAKARVQMQQEQATGMYDLNALRVDVGKPTDSETPFEDK